MSRKLLQLLRDNAGRINNGADGAPIIRSETANDGVHLYVYDIIDPWYGCSAGALVIGITNAAGKTIHLHINSAGGDVFEARAMSAALAAHDGKVIAHIDGVCASAATYLALAASEARMTDGALFMIHNSMGMVWGNKAEMRTTADLLDKVDGQIAADYARKTGKSTEEINALMEAETWFTPQEALDNGFIDVIDSNTKSGNTKNLAGKWNLSAYANAPKLAELAPPDPAVLDAEIAAQQLLNRNRLRLLDCQI